ncbi:MAG: MG2 domain-containing protein [Saprospiraceae bacterium]
MQYLFSILSLFFSMHQIEKQDFDYNSAWNQVDSLMEQGLPKSALKHVSFILETAKQAKVHPQWAKAVIFYTRLSIQTEEDGVANSILFLQNEKKHAPSPLQQVFSSYLAQLYEGYFNNNRYQISQRTFVEGERNEDFKLWSKENFADVIHELYLESLQHDESLDIGIMEYAVILESTEKLDIAVRPSLYEVLADRVFNYFNSNQYQIRATSKNNVIKNNSAFSKVEEFVNIKWDDQDKKTTSYGVLKLYQQVLKYELFKDNQEALADYDLKRMRFVDENSISNHDSKNYIQALEILAERHKNIPFYAEIIYEIASKVEGNSFDSLNHINALLLCDKGIQAYPTSSGAYKCLQLKNSIISATCDAEALQVFHSKEPLAIQLNYKNLDGLTVHVIKTNTEEIEQFRGRYNENIVELFLAKESNAKLDFKLEPTRDYNTTKKSIVIPNPGYGVYAVVLVGKSADTHQVVKSYLITHVSDLSFISSMIKKDRVIQVLDRWKGSPVADVSIQLYEQVYNSRMRTHNRKLHATLKSDKNGKAVSSEREKTYMVTLIKDKDTLDLSTYLDYFIPDSPSSHQFVEFYTDRSLYRPGQTVYFKGLVLNSDKDQIPTIIKNRNVTVTLKDANYQNVASHQLKSNEYGSISGHFVLPSGLLNGAFTIVTEAHGMYGQTSISVEEYKRPTYNIVFDSINDAYTIGQSIKVTGTVMTFAGTPVDNADVEYVIHRKMRFPWYYSRRMPMETAVRLATGTMKTDSDGKFDISFIADPDERTRANKTASFNYSVTASVTDSRGETQNGEVNVQAAFKPYFLHIDVATHMDKGALKDATIEANNANGSNMKIPVRVRILKLMEPKDISLPSYENQNRPFDYRIHNTSDATQSPYEKWPTEKQMYESQVMTPSKISIPNNWDLGVYKVEVMDSNDNEIQAVQYIVITDVKRKKFPKTEPIHLVIQKSILAPGEKLKLTLGNATGLEQYVQVLISKDRNILYYGLEKVDKVKEITLPILDSYRGDINVQIDYIYHNRHFSQSQNISIPWINKSLNIEFVSLRDRTLPGENEVYKLRIKGEEKDAFLVEVLASMYDASLDEFKKHSWNYDFYPKSSSYLSIITAGFSTTNAYSSNYNQTSEILEPIHIHYPTLIALYPYYQDSYFQSRDMAVQAMGAPEPRMRKGAPAKASSTAFSESESNDASIDPDMSTKSSSIHPTIRTNLNETVFFFPQLLTDKDGNIEFAFKMNDALTMWKLMVLAHTPDLKIGYKEALVKTQKNIMVFPNFPRFFRDSDLIHVKAKVNNLTSEKQVGTVSLQFFDALSMVEVTDEILKDAAVKNTTIYPSASKTDTWALQIPEAKYSALTYRISADFGSHLDIEEGTLQVFTNRILVTETMPIWVNGNETRTFDFSAFTNNVSTSKKDFRYTVEFTSHPVWYAIQAMPYLSNESNTTISLMNRFFTNSVASHIVHSHPRIKKVFDTWRREGKDALLSNLSKNEELKQAILKETPWVQEAMSESEQKQNISVLFDLNNLANEKKSILTHLKNSQHSNGGFPWIMGGRDDLYTSLYVLENLAQLKSMGIDISGVEDIESIQDLALDFVDQEMLIKYNKLVESLKKHGGKLDDDHLDDVSAFYIYVRSLFSKTFVSENHRHVFNYYMGQASKYWNTRNLFTQANLGLALFRNSDQTWKKIVASLTEKAVSNPELGTYWNEGNGFNWSQLPIERHARIMELFIVTQSNLREIDKMKIWLLKNKQTNIWHTSKSTVSAIYALLIQGEQNGITSNISEVKPTIVTVGNIDLNTKISQVEAGTGYVKTSFKGDELKQDMAKITVQNPNNSIAWGAAYYQYFEVLEKVDKFSGTPFKISKKYYKINTKEASDALTEITSNDVLKIGDKVKVRIILETDRDLDFVHLKDLRPSGFEPISVLSGHRHQDGLYYYESVTDLASHFYFDTLRKGKYVFEYPVVVSHAGDYTGGITTAQCLYAPEFSSHSEGVKVEVVE